MDCRRRDETLFHSQKNQYTAKEEKLSDDKAIKASQGDLKMFPNSFQPKLIPVPISRCLPALSLESSLLGMETVSDSRGEWEGEWCWQKERKCFFNLEPEVLTLSCMCLGTMAHANCDVSTFPESLAQRLLASGCRSHSYFSLPTPKSLRLFPPSWKC